MRETVYSLFDQSGAPITGLSPTISGIDGISGSVLFSGSMEELASGWYKYKIDKYDKTKTYLITVDGGASVTEGRIQSIVNELDAYPNKTDRRSISVIDPEEIARVIWSMEPENMSSGIGGILSKGFDYSTIMNMLELIKSSIKGVDASQISVEYKGITIEDIELLLNEKDLSDDIKSIISIGKGLEKATKKIQSSIDDIKDGCDAIYEGIDQIDDKEKIESMIQEMKKISSDFDNIIEKVNGFDEIMDNVKDMPGLVDSYKSILSTMSSNKSLEDKIVSIKLSVNDILKSLNK